MAQHVLVTGGAGYVGSHACKALAAAGYVPVVYDNLSRGHAWAVRWGPLERGDILDADRLGAVLRRYRPVAVLHFAGVAYVGESTRDPALYYATNVAGSLCVLDAMRTAGVDCIVFSSTCATYGRTAAMQIDETVEQRPINPYGRSKLMVEMLLADHGAYGIRSVILRYFNAAGADPEGEIGEEHDPEPHLIPLMLAAARGTAPPLTVFGTDYETPDGTCIRDFVHVADLARAHVAALEYLRAGGSSTAFNLGSGQGISVRTLIARAEAVCGRPVPVRLGARRDGDPPRLVASSARARTVLDWVPSLSDIETILGTAWAWTGRRRERA